MGMTAGFALLFAAASLLQGTPQEAGNWPQWRGPNANGLMPDAKPPVEWSESRNVKWKVKLPGSGASTPIVWEDRIFILTAVDTKRTPEGGKAAPAPRPAGRRRGRFRMSTGAPKTLHAFDVLCLDRETGRTLWRKTGAGCRSRSGSARGALRCFTAIP